MKNFLLLTIFFSIFCPIAVLSQWRENNTIKKFPSQGIDRYDSEHFGFLAGIWIPTGDLQILGNHPSIGMQWGFRANTHEFNATVDVRFLKSKNDYDVFRPDSHYTLNEYIGGYIGVDYVYYFISSNRADIGFLLGLGYDGFSLPRNKIPFRPYEIGSFNFNAGIRFNVYTNGETYLSILPRYNFINYGNKGGTSFSGNGISIDIFIGGLWEAGTH